MRNLISLAAALVLAGCATTNGAGDGGIPAGSRYVAMGSSFAAGAGIGPTKPGTPERCGRTINNYATLLATRLKLALDDVTCGGATTAHLLGPWNELPAQIAAVTPATRLVTLTVGSNDVSFIRNLYVASCGQPGLPAPAGRGCPASAPPTEADWAGLEQRFREIVREVSRRAPEAKIVVVDYLRIFPDQGGCAVLSLSAEGAVTARETFRRLAELTARVAGEEGATLLRAGELSQGHDACSAAPWATGFPSRPVAPWHPTAAGHAAIADALSDMLSR